MKEVRISAESLLWLLKNCGNYNLRNEFIAWICTKSCPGSQLDQRQTKVARAFLASQQFQSIINELHFIQWSHRECAASIGCNVLNSKRWRKWLIEQGFLIPIHKGCKEFPAMFCLSHELPQGPIHPFSPMRRLPSNVITNAYSTKQNERPQPKP